MTQDSSSTPSPAPSSQQSGIRRLLGGESLGTESLESHLKRLGSLPATGRRDKANLSQLLDEVERSGLSGRGGARFSTYKKITSVQAVKGRRVVVANGAEGEPESAKDRVLLEMRPHLVLDGISLACALIGAAEAHLCVGRRGEAALACLHEAVRERSAQGIDRIPPEIHEFPDRFVAGEETSLLRWLEGGDAKPKMVPPLPVEKGLGARPTLVLNVETLAHVALIARFGGDWFREVGDPSDPGTMLVTVAGAVEFPGVREIATGSSLLELLSSAGVHRSAKEVLLGGYYGAWASLEDGSLATMSKSGLAPLGASVGAGVVLALDAAYCGLVESARLVSWLASESAGQCGPCKNGLPAVAQAMAAIAMPRNAEPSQVAKAVRWAAQIEGRGACHHPDGALKIVASALKVFEDDLEEHLSGRCLRAAGAFLPLPPPSLEWR